MQRYQSLGMQLRLKRVESGLHQKTWAFYSAGPHRPLLAGGNPDDTCPETVTWAR